MDVLLITIAIILALVACCEAFWGFGPVFRFEFKNVWMQRVCRLCLPFCALLLLIGFFLSPLDSFGANLTGYLVLAFLGALYVFVIECILGFFIGLYRCIRNRKFKEPVQNLLHKICSWFWAKE